MPDIDDIAGQMEPDPTPNPERAKQALFLIDAVASVGDPDRINEGLKKLMAMEPDQLVDLMAKTQPSTHHLQNLLKSRPSAIRKIVMILNKFEGLFGDEVVDQLISDAMGVASGKGGYDEDGDFYYDPGGDDEGGGH